MSILARSSDRPRLMRRGCIQCTKPVGHCRLVALCDTCIHRAGAVPNLIARAYLAAYSAKK